MDVATVLKKVPLFGELPKEALARLADIVSRQKLPKDACLFSEGEAATGFFVVVSGQIRVYKLSPAGKEHTLHVFGAHQPVGEAAVFAGQPFPANAITLERSELLFFPRDAFLKLIAKHPAVAMQMLAILSKRLMGFTAMVEGLALKEIPSRLAAYLVHLPRAAGEGDCVELDMSKRNLASVLGATPETLSRALAKLTKEEYIAQTGSRRVKVLDRKGLAQLGAGRIPE